MRKGLAALGLAALASAAACASVANGGHLSQPSAQPAVPARTVPWDTMPCAGACAPITDVALATDGTLYVAQRGGDQLLTLPSGSTTWATGRVKGSAVEHVVVGPNGDVYATAVDPGSNRAEVIKLDATTTTQTVYPIDGLGAPDSMAIADSGDVYVAGPSRHASGRRP